MTGISNIYGGTETAKPVEPGSESSRRRRQEIHEFRYVASDVAAVASALERRRKRQKLEVHKPLVPSSSSSSPHEEIDDLFKLTGNEDSDNKSCLNGCVVRIPKSGVTSVCGKRRDMEDAVALHPSFAKEINEKLHFYGVYDGHGCSHVAMRCKDRMHEIVKDELKAEGDRSWNETMATSFSRMDREITEWSTTPGVSSPCRCEMRTSQCDAVGSTSVVAVVTPDKIVVSNCGDSRAVLCRNGVAIPLSVDHKPDRPDELTRIEEAGGRVIYWDGARVLGVLAMSRAIGDNYLKPFVIPEPEVTVTDRTSDDECLILASDGLWDVVSNETACNVARMCLKPWKTNSRPQSPGNDVSVNALDIGSSNKPCSDASMLLTKLALARHSSDNVSVVVVDLRRNS